MKVIQPMNSSIFFGGSVLAAVIAGAIALFAALTAMGLRDKGDHEPEPAVADAS